MAYITPTISSFSTFDAQEVYIIEFVGDVLSGQYDSWNWTLRDITNSNMIEWAKKTIEIIDESLEDYIQNKISNITEPKMIYYNYNYYLIINSNFFQNGCSYSSQIIFYDLKNVAYATTFTTFKCYSKPSIELEKCEYQDGTLVEISNPIVIEKVSCKLTYSYTQDEGDGLKYYQFFLYDNDSDGNERLLGSSSKIYSQSEIEYTVENYNNLKNYTLKLYCITQSGIEQWYNVNIFINYNQNNVYANITFDFDEQFATNNVLIKITQLSGSGEEYSYSENGDSVIIPDNGYVEFIDQYQSISNNFLCKMWCTNLSKNIPILTINTTDGVGKAEVFFTGTSFIAKKYSCNLITSYICYIENVETDISQNVNIYFAIGYFDGRIEMYATILG
jgi:hypothetical protein